MPELILHIRPEGARHYLARVFDGKELVGEPTLHSTVEEAIRAYSGSPAFPHVAAFNIWYAGWSVGLIPVARMRTEAAELASRLIVLSAVLR